MSGKKYFLSLLLFLCWEVARTEDEKSDKICFLFPKSEKLGENKIKEIIQSAKTSRVPKLIRPQRTFAAINGNPPGSKKRRGNIIKSVMFHQCFSNPGTDHSNVN